MKKVALVMLIVVCLLVATQLSADVYTAFEDLGFTWIETETKIDVQEDVIICAADGERVAVYSADTQQASIPGFEIIPDSGVALELIFDYSAHSKYIKPEALPYIKGL